MSHRRKGKIKMLKRKTVEMERELKKRLSFSSDEEDLLGTPIIKKSNVKTGKKKLKIIF